MGHLGYTTCSSKDHSPEADIFAEANHPPFYSRQVANALLSIKGTVHDQMSLLNL